MAVSLLYTPYAHSIYFPDFYFPYFQVQVLEERLANATAKHEEDIADMSQRLDSLQRKVAFLFRRNEKLSEQLGFLNEVAIRYPISKAEGFS